MMLRILKQSLLVLIFLNKILFLMLRKLRKPKYKKLINALKIEIFALL